MSTTCVIMLSFLGGSLSKDFNVKVFKSCPFCANDLINYPSKVCTYAAHSRCLDNILGQCTGAAKTSAQSMVNNCICVIVRGSVFVITVFILCILFIALCQHLFSPQFLKERFKIDVPHQFKPAQFFGPTFCDLCGQMIYGLFKQGMRCKGVCT